MVLVSIVTPMPLRTNYRWMMCVSSVGKPWQQLPRSYRVITFSTPLVWGHGFRDSRLVPPVGGTYWERHPPHHKPHPLNPHNPLRHNPHKTVCQRILIFFLNYLFLKYQVQMICVWFNFSFWGYGWHASTDVAPAPCPSPSAKCSPARLVPICISHQKDEKVHVHTTVCRDFNTIQWRSHNWFSGISCLTGSTQAPQSGTSTATVSSTFTQPSVSAPTTTTFPGMPATGCLPTGMPPMMPMVPLMMPFG